MKIDERKIPLGNPRATRMEYERANAEALAIAALAFLADDPERLEQFLSLSGLDPSHLRRVAGETGFMVGILDHIAGDEKLLLAFAAHQRCDPAAISKARYVLDPPEVDFP